MVQIMGNALWQLIKQSDTMSKGVLLLLLIMSILCWTIFLYKWMLFRTKKRIMREALMRIKSATTLEQIVEIAADYTGTMPGYFLSKNLASLKMVLEANKDRSVPSLTDRQWEMLQVSMEQTVDDMLHHEESMMSFLSVSFAMSPLLGLFGTVWGLIHSFIRISEKQSADIVTVAPGIAEALITTLAGLMVAIPALVMFNILSNQLRYLEKELLILADRMNMVIQKVCVR